MDIYGQGLEIRELAPKEISSDSNLAGCFNLCSQFLISITRARSSQHALGSLNANNLFDRTGVSQMVITGANHLVASVENAEKRICDARSKGPI